MQPDTRGFPGLVQHWRQGARNPGQLPPRLGQQTAAVKHNNRCGYYTIFNRLSTTAFYTKRQDFFLFRTRISLLM